MDTILFVFFVIIIIVGVDDKLESIAREKRLRGIIFTSLGFVNYCRKYRHCLPSFMARKLSMLEKKVEKEN